jgi:hypothetical protein
MKDKKPTILISMSVAWAIRNYLHTGIVDELLKFFNVVIVTTSKIRDRILEQGYGRGIIFESYDELVEPTLWKLMRELKKKIYMESRLCSTEELWERYRKRPIYQKLGGSVIKMLNKCIDGKRLLSAVEFADTKLNSDFVFKSLFNKYKPCLLFATHASHYFEESLVRAAWSNRVPAALMVLSWDHISSKIVLGNKYSRILVWNRWMKSEILDTYSCYKEDAIRVVGIPHFDIYASKPVCSYDSWCEKYKLNPKKKTITFFTMPQVRHSEQHIIIGQILKAIDDGRIRHRDVQLLIKYHPFDDMVVYSSLLNSKNVRMCATTLNGGGKQEEWYPRPDELEISRDCLYHSHITMNIFSTVTLEAAIFDKPIINIAYDITPPVNRIPCREYYNFAHFRDITNFSATKLVTSETELIDAINIYLANPRMDSENRKRLIAEYCGNVDGNSAMRVVEQLLEFVHSRQ